MALKGTLRDFGLADIFQLIGIQRKTGVLELRNGDRQVRVSFLAGGVVSANTSNRSFEERLGAVLVKSGKITDRQLGEALKTQKNTLQRLGRILVEQKALTTEDLQDALRVQVTQIVHHLFRWRDGEYDFSQEETLDYDREHFTPIPADNILMEGARMIDEWPIIERRIQSFDMILRRKAGAPVRDTGPISVFDTDIDFGFMDTGTKDKEDDPARLSAEEATVLNLVDGRSTVQDIIDRSQLGEFEACRILYELMNRELVEEGLGATPRVEAPSAPLHRSLVLRLGLLLMPVLAGLSMVFSLDSPLSPVSLRGGSDPFRVERIRSHLSQARIGRIDQAVRLFHLDHQELPGSLEALAREGFLSPKDLLDPWGRPYDLQIQPSGYSIHGYSPTGAPDAAISLQSQFVATQRLAIAGETDEASSKSQE